MAEETGLGTEPISENLSDHRQKLISELRKFAYICNELSQYGYGYKVEILPYGLETLGWSNLDSDNQIKKISQIISWESVSYTNDLLIQCKSVLSKITYDLGDYEGYQKIQNY